MTDEYIPKLFGAEIDLLQMLADNGVMTFMQINAVSHNTYYWVKLLKGKGCIEHIEGQGYAISEIGRKALENVKSA